MIDYAIDIMEKYIIPPFERIKDIRTCVEFLREYDGPKLLVYSQGDMHYFDEGLINLMAYDSVEEFAEYRKEAFENGRKKLLLDIKKGKCGYTKEDYEKEIIRREERMNRQIENFDQLLNNQDYRDKALEEMARRKKANTELLRNVGFNI